MTLPPPIATYFAADAARDEAALAASFAPGARVQDESRIHAGPEAIAAWWRAAKARYNHSAEVLDMERLGAQILVRARVTGDFPGSPLVLRYAFGLAGDRIDSLQITA